MSNTPICELSHVTKTYGPEHALVRAVDDVTLTIAKGEFTVFCGPSGSGKTTLLNQIGCLDEPSSGEVRIDGVATLGLRPRALARLRAQKIGFIFQSFNLVPVLTAVENVELALQLAKHEGNLRDAAMDLLQRVGLGALEHRRPNEMSGGQQQRVAIARALVKRPVLVIADEPTANLDSETGKQVLSIMEELNAELGITFLFSTHDPMVMDHARRVVKLHDGKVVSDETRSALGAATASAGAAS